MRWLSLALVVAATLAAHLLAGPPTVVLGVQAIASGTLLWANLKRRLRWLGAVAALVLLAGILLGARVSPHAARDAATGLAHAMLYASLLFIFGRSLLPNRVALVTGLAQRLNPRFRAEMIPYTRKVTVVWCLFALAQLTASASLLYAGRFQAWLLLVTVLHAPMVVGLALLEYLARCIRFPGEHTGLLETIRGVRAGMR